MPEEVVQPRRGPAPSGPATPDEVAQWMFEEFQRRDGLLLQGEAALEIRDRFGARHVLATDRNGLSIREKVRRAFRQKCQEEGTETIWTWGPHAWRRRTPDDPPDARAVAE